MAIQERLLGLAMEFRFHLLAAAALAAAVFSLLSVGPSFATVVSFFWPLLLSTGFLLAAVAVLLRISPPPEEAAAERTGEELIHYVAGRPEEAPQDRPPAGVAGEAAEGNERGEEEHPKSQ
ncbi:uncharacterized protein LOC103722742 [Phoenix dactylifera]|uniref:Uncharacterized protein LOC103722742 n=1 Tax=Phoenix dactylifera TaxID=42345 RepID=A0A8B7D2F9_PHODC|nr:uncharacterized protein LOC103722742 [Phoenix dactylifera]